MDADEVWRAIDVPWTRGSGPAGRGPIEAVLLVLTGRPAARPRLTGPGVGVVRDRGHARAAE